MSFTVSNYLIFLQQQQFTPPVLQYLRMWPPKTQTRGQEISLLRFHPSFILFCALSRPLLIGWVWSCGEGSEVGGGETDGGFCLVICGQIATDGRL